MKSKYFKKLFLGPMSKNIVDAIIEFNKDNENYFGLIPSRRQIECLSLGSGYVNNWSTESFKKYVGNNLVLRDHGGPGQGKEKDDGKISLAADINAGVNFLHIDPWKNCKTIDSGIYETLNLIKYCLSIDPGCMFEIGTEEAIYPYTPVELEKIIKTIKSCLGDQFKNVVYGVVQSGTKIKEMRNTGKFDHKKSKEMSGICKKYGIFAKEHNTDYLTIEEIKMRINSGVDSLNIAPELGIIETGVILDELEKNKKLKQEFLDICYNSKKWVKWVDNEPGKDKIARICGHYMFSTEEFIKIKQKLPIDIDKKIKNRIKTKLSLLKNI